MFSLFSKGMTNGASGFLVLIENGRSKKENGLVLSVTRPFSRRFDYINHLMLVMFLVMILLALT